MNMARGRPDLVQLIVSILAAFTVVHAQRNESGFISIDCGSAEAYTDAKTGTSYVPDAEFIDSGVNRDISTEYMSDDLQARFGNLRSFPDGQRNCYTLRLENVTQYLMRAQFMYGNYDSKRQVTEFDLYIGVNLWSTIRFSILSEVLTVEMIHLPSAEATNVCLVNKGLGTPFISVLEIRPMDNVTYTSSSGTLNLLYRLNLGAELTDETRFIDDPYDRIWNPTDYWASTANYLLTNETINTDNSYDPPSKVMSTAATPRDANGWLTFSWTANVRTEHYIFMHFAELQNLGVNQSREFDIYVNGRLFYGTLVPEKLSVTTVYAIRSVAGTWFNMSLRMTENSTLPPIINALEIYMLNSVPQSDTNPADVQAVYDIKSIYSLDKIWQGDPCAPITYSWDGLVCSFNGSDPPRIITLNLSSSKLVGQISEKISGLEFLQNLDLSNNSLSGSIPDFLSAMKFLKFINLKGNNLTGAVPADLIKKSQAGTLTLRLDNYYQCSSDSCITTKTRPSVAIAASASAFLVFLTISAVICWKWKTHDIRLKETVKLKKFRFTHSRVRRITKNFSTVIGEGGFGKVYLGTLRNGVSVAVKSLSSGSDQGLKEFKQEIEALTKADHVNVVSLVGFCDELKHLALIYEYMPNGNLKDQLSEKSSTSFLRWEDRLQIAVNAAEGLDYLHNGCDPPILHCDLKTSNILLDATMRGKLADFGLSKAYRHVDATHISTMNPAGTPGYMDIECAVSGQFSMGSDMYSFGVILMELVTGKPALAEDGVPLFIWLPSEFDKQGIQIVDKRMEGNFNSDAARTILEIAIACVQQPSYGRPQISHVLAELKQLLEADELRSGSTWETRQLTHYSTVE